MPQPTATLCSALYILAAVAAVASVTDTTGAELGAGDEGWHPMHQRQSILSESFKAWEMLTTI